MSLRVQGHLRLRWNRGEKEIGMKTKSSEMARMQTALGILFLAIRLARAGQTADAAVAEANPLGRELVAGERVQVNLHGLGVGWNRANRESETRE